MRTVYRDKDYIYFMQLLVVMLLYDGNEGLIQNVPAKYAYRILFNRLSYLLYPTTTLTMWFELSHSARPTTTKPQKLSTV